MPQGIDENYNGAPDMMEQGGESPDPTALKMLLAKLVEMLGLGQEEPAGETPGAVMQRALDAPPYKMDPSLKSPAFADPGEDQTAIETEMRGGKSFDEAHGTDLEGSGSFQPPANKGKLDAFRAKLKGAKAGM